MKNWGYWISFLVLFISNILLMTNVFYYRSTAQVYMYEYATCIDTAKMIMQSVNTLTVPIINNVESTNIINQQNELKIKPGLQRVQI